MKNILDGIVDGDVDVDVMGYDKFGNAVDTRDDYRKENLLRGLTEAGQKLLARDVFGGLAKKAGKVKSFRTMATDPRTGEVVAGKTRAPYNGGEDLVKMYESMPEEMRDSFLLTAMSTPVHFSDAGGKASNYKLFNGNVYMTNEDPGALLHELGHATMQRMNPWFPEKEITSIPISSADKWTLKKFYPDMSATDNIGKRLHNDFIKDYVFDANVPMDYRTTDFRIRKNIFNDFMKNVDYGTRNLGAHISNFVEDAAGLDPESKVFMDTKSSHNGTYKQDLQKLHSPLGEDRASYAPLSMEGTANLFRLMGMKGGAEWVKKNMPDTYNRLMELFSKDHRKEKFVAPERYRIFL